MRRTLRRPAPRPNAAAAFKAAAAGASGAHASSSSEDASSSDDSDADASDDDDDSCYYDDDEGDGGDDIFFAEQYPGEAATAAVASADELAALYVTPEAFAVAVAHDASLAHHPELSWLLAGYMERATPADGAPLMFIRERIYAIYGACCARESDALLAFLCAAPHARCRAASAPLPRAADCTDGTADAPVPVPVFPDEPEHEMGDADRSTMLWPPRRMWTPQLAARLGRQAGPDDPETMEGQRNFVPPRDEACPDWPTRPYCFIGDRFVRMRGFHFSAVYEFIDRRIQMQRDWLVRAPLSFTAAPHSLSPPPCVHATALLLLCVRFCVASSPAALTQLRMHACIPLPLCGQDDTYVVRARPVGFIQRRMYASAALSRVARHEEIVRMRKLKARVCARTCVSACLPPHPCMHACSSGRAASGTRICIKF